MYLKNLLRPIKANIKFHKKVHLPQNQGDMICTSPREHQPYRIKSTDQRRNDKRTRLEMSHVAGQSDGGRLLFPHCAEFNPHGVGKYIDRCPGVKQTRSGDRTPLISKRKRQIRQEACFLQFATGCRKRESFCVTHHVESFLRPLRHPATRLLLQTIHRATRPDRTLPA